MTEAATDLARWRLEVDKGRQVWQYLSPEEAQEWPQTAYDKYWLGILDVKLLLVA
jgi:lanosterol synthase